MLGINNYHIELSEDEIEKGMHRGLVGGLWDELGKLQLEFMINQGLKSSNTLLDIGCGSLRGGIKFIDYLEQGKYFGVDINSSLLCAGKKEIERHQLSHKSAILIESDSFDSGLELKFDFILAVSLFTHLPVNYIDECLYRVKSQLAENGKFYASFFTLDVGENKYKSHCHHPGDIVTYHNKDPYHYWFDEIAFYASQHNLLATYIGDWSHPRSQVMIQFTHK